MHKFPYTTKKFSLSALVFVFCFLLATFAFKVDAATLTLSTPTLTQEVGKTFTVRVLVDSPHVTAHTIAASIDYPEHLIEIENISKTGSILNAWNIEPTFKNGKIIFEGQTAKGFKGEGASLFTIDFKTIAAGNASLLIASSSVFAHDGKITEIPSDVRSISLRLMPSANDPASANLPLAPIVSSPTHSDQVAWYKNSSPEFKWDIPKGITSIRLSYDTDKVGNPTVVYEPTLTSKKIENVEDGAYYFHIQFQNAEGWGPVSTYAFNIDTVAPTINSAEAIPHIDVLNPLPILDIKAQDETSGVAEYTLTTNHREIISFSNSSLPYNLRSVAPGDKVIDLKVFDKAGNIATTTLTYTIKPIAPPRIETYTPSIETGKIMKVQGKTIPNALIMIAVRPGNVATGTPTTEINNASQDVYSYRARSNDKGDFTYYISDVLRPKLYTASVVVENNDGARSDAQAALFKFDVKKKSRETVTSEHITYLLIILFIVTLLGFIIWLLQNIADSHKKLQQLVKKNILDIEEDVHKQYDRIHSELVQDEMMLKQAAARRSLTPEEKNVEESVSRLLKEKDDKLQEGLQKIEDDINKK